MLIELSGHICWNTVAGRVFARRRIVVGALAPFGVHVAAAVGVDCIGLCVSGVCYVTSYTEGPKGAAYKLQATQHHTTIATYKLHTDSL